MSDYLSHIAARSSGTTQANAVRPEATSRYSAADAPQDIVEETIPQAEQMEQVTFQNPLDNLLAPHALVPRHMRGEAHVLTEPNVTAHTPPQYLEKQIERFYPEKPVFYAKTDKKEGATSEAAKETFIDNQTVYENSQISQIMNQIFNQNTILETTTSKPILQSNEEKGGQFLKNTEGVLLNQEKPKSSLLTPNDRPIKLYPTALAQERQTVKTTASKTPKLVIGRISVEILPPVAPLVKTIVRTEHHSSNTATTADTSFHKLSFGLGQL